MARYRIMQEYNINTGEPVWYAYDSDGYCILASSRSAEDCEARLVAYAGKPEPQLVKELEL